MKGKRKEGEEGRESLMISNIIILQSTFPKISIMDLDL